jgi:hypothetical protein
MKKWTFQPEKVKRAIAALKKSGRKIPSIERHAGEVLKRHQWQCYASAINFTAPIEVEKCGRFNPVGGCIAVWYASDAALTAMAESYGRMVQLVQTVSYPESVLDQHYICSVDVLKEVEVIDVVALLALLHIPLDSLENEDYTFPQWLMERLYTEFGDEYDGIAYDSRHRRYKKCFAFWRKPQSNELFKDTAGGMTSLKDYKEYDAEIFPSDWRSLYISGEDMLEELLNFEITPELQ